MGIFVWSEIRGEGRGQARTRVYFLFQGYLLCQTLLLLLCCGERWGNSAVAAALSGTFFFFCYCHRSLPLQEACYCRRDSVSCCCPRRGQGVCSQGVFGRAYRYTRYNILWMYPGIVYSACTPGIAYSGCTRISTWVWPRCLGFL